MNENCTAIMRPGLIRNNWTAQPLPSCTVKKRTSTMNGSLHPAAGIPSRLLSTCVVGCWLLLAGVQAYAAEASDLDLAVSDVFPVTRADLDFTDDPAVLLLAQASTGSEVGKVWESTLPPTDEFDWIQTTSGEWLKGELKQLYSGSLEFDSDEFDLQTLDWDDVAQLRGHGEKRISIDTLPGARCAT